MSSLSPKDRVSLCSFTFSDVRRCRTKKTGKHPRFCFYHAQKEARARTAKKLGKDLAYFFSGEYVSACDLSTALARLIPAVVRGDVRPRTARTVAYLVQTLLQTIHISEQEYINAFDTDDWRKAIRNSVNGNHDYLFPRPDPQPQPSPSHPPQPQPQPRASNPSPTPAPAPQPPPSPPPKPVSITSQPAPPAAQPPTISPQASSPAHQPAVPKPQATSPLPQKPLQPNQPATQASHPNIPSPIAPPTQQRSSATPNRDPYAVRYDHNYRPPIDGKPF